MKVNVIIPTYKPDDKFEKNLRMLRRQTLQPDRILIINTEESLFHSKEFEKLPQGEIVHIRKEEFDHGGTRNRAAALCDGEIIVLLTQDAIPADEFLLENLTKPFADADVCAAYGRQMADWKDNPVEAYTRTFNYPKESRVKSEKDLPVLGIKTFFCSNVCAAYRKSVYDELGGFPLHTIFNEDMIFASRLIEAGKKIAYAADAKVWHWHNYSAVEQCKRNFDLAVSQKDHPEVFSGLRSEGEGIRLVKETAGYLIRSGRGLLVFKLVIDSGCKYMGYLAGKRYKRLPRWLILRCTMNRNYWRENDV